MPSTETSRDGTESLPPTSLTQPPACVVPPADSSGCSAAKLVPRGSINVVRLSELSGADRLCWDRIRLEQSDFAAPFFSPRFAHAVNECRGDVLVAVLNGDGSANNAVGYFPFHRNGRVGKPVGRFLNDAQNVVLAPGWAVDWTAMMAACDVRAFDLHAIIAPADEWTRRYRLSSVRAFHADLGGNSPAFLKNLRKQHRTIEKQGQKTRKMAREMGPLRLQVDCRDMDQLRKTIQWKRDQYNRTHILDLFLPDWTRQLLMELHSETFVDAGNPKDDSRPSLADVPLRGLHTVLWAGDVPVAAHIGMIERGRLHYWFPTYDPAYAIYSPGTALFTELMEAATSVGIDLIDMGYGEQPYKQKQTTSTTHVGAGTITDSSIHRWQHETRAKCLELIRGLPMKEQAKRVWRSLFPSAGVGKLK